MPPEIADRLRRHDEDTQTDRDTRTATDRAIIGAVGGLIATLVMTVFRMPISESLPPTADFWARYVGSGEPEDYPVIGLVLHLTYGVAGGLAFATLAPGSGESDALAETKNAVAGTVYGMVLSVFGARVLLERMLGMDLETDDRLIFHLSHLIYGLTLGTWVGSRLGTD